MNGLTDGIDFILADILLPGTISFNFLYQLSQVYYIHRYKCCMIINISLKNLFYIMLSMTITNM